MKHGKALLRLLTAPDAAVGPFKTQNIERFVSTDGNSL
jgi:hypothetical protein